MTEEKQNEITVRQMKAEDGGGIKELCVASPDTGSYSYYPDFHINPCDGLSSQYPDNAGVVVTHSSHGVIGVGDSIYGRCRFNGGMRDFAYLKAYHVHRDFRRYKAGTRINRTLEEMARKNVGNDVLILGSVQTDNVPQQRMLAKSSGWRINTLFNSGLFSLKKRKPWGGRDWTIESVGPSMENEIDRITEGLNSFYRDYNLYEPQTSGTFSRWLSNTLFETPFIHYYIVKDNRGNILAGMGVVEEYRVRTFVACEIPFKIKAANLLLKIIPKNNVIRQLIGAKIWFAEGEEAAGKYLFDYIRYHWREMGDIFVCHYDPRSPLAKMLALPKWRPRVEYYSMGPEIMDDRLICPII